MITQREIKMTDTEDIFGKEMSREEINVWIEKGQNTKIGNFQEFLNDMIENIPVSYGNVVYSTAIASSTIAHILSSHYGITGFQAGCVQWEWIRQWGIFSSEVGLRMLNYQDMCYPQHESSFTTISKDTFERMQTFCQDRIEKSNQDYETYKETLSEWKLKIIEFETKYPDYKDSPEKYEQFTGGTQEEWNEAQKRRILDLNLLQ